MANQTLYFFYVIYLFILCTHLHIWQLLSNNKHFYNALKPAQTQLGGGFRGLNIKMSKTKRLGI